MQLALCDAKFLTRKNHTLLRPLNFTTMLSSQPKLAYLDKSLALHPKEWNINELRNRFGIAVSQIQELRKSDSLRWTAV